MKNKTGFNQYIEQLYPLALTVVGYVFFLFTITLFISGAFIVGIVFLIIGVFLSFSVVGIQVDSEKNRFNYYERILFVKMGKWRSFDEFPDVSVLTINQKHSSRSLTNMEFTSKSIVYKVHLLNETHREKIMIQIFKEEEKAILFAKDFAARTGTNFTIFSPEISEATLSRRR